MVGAHRIAVVIPCYDVGPQIAGVVSSLPPLVDLVVIVDDGSAEPVERHLAGRTDPRVVVRVHDRNLGLARAMATGYDEALRRGAAVVVKMDGDGQMDPEALPRIVAPILEGAADLAKGNRFIRRRLFARMPLVRRVGNLGLSFLGKAATGYWQLFDPTNGYVAVRRELLAAIDTARLGPGYFFEISLLREAYLAGAVAMDVPLAARYGDEVSHLSIARVLVAFPVHLARSVLRRIALRYFLWDFTAVSLFLLAGLPMCAFGLGFGLWQWASRWGSPVPTPAGTLVLAGLPLVLGFQLLLQALAMDIGNVPTRSGWPSLSEESAPQRTADNDTGDAARYARIRSSRA